MELTLRQLDYFIALAEVGHFGRAAARVHVTQPALSVQIRELETRLGVRLVDRAGGFRLTPAGHEVLASATRIAREVERMKSMAGWGAHLRGRLKLGVIPTVAPYLLPVALPRLRGHDATLDLALSEARTERLIDALEQGMLDAAILALPTGRASLVERHLFDDRFVLAGPAAQIAGLRARGAVARPEQIDPASLLLLDEGHCLADQALEACATSRGATRVDLGASSLATLSGLVAAGFGLTLLPELALASELRGAPGLGVARFLHPEPMRRIGLVRRDLPGATGWFDELADLLAEAGREALSHAPDAWG